jgi:hypothetical protein
VSVILYTSGTTADPKGVLHSDNTLLAECANTVRYHGLSDDEVFVMPSPVSHISGLLYGIMLPIVLGGTSVLMEAWDPQRFLALVERERGTYSAGATPFLQGVVESPHLSRYDLRSLRRFPCGGADVPPELIRRAMPPGRALGAQLRLDQFPASPARRADVPGSGPRPMERRSARTRSSCATPMGVRSRAVGRARSGRMERSCSSATATRRSTPRPSMNGASSAPATWACSTPTAI